MAEFESQFELYSTMVSMGNPFGDDCPELLALDSRNCASEYVVATVQKIKEIGLTQYQTYVSDVVVARTVSIHQSIKKNSLPLFKRRFPRVCSKTKQQVVSLKSDCNLFSHLYIASQYHDGDLDEFCSHENHPWPPSLSDHGKLRLPTKKADLLSHLDSGIATEPPSNFDAKVFDGAIVHTLPTKQAATFVEYGDKVFLSWTKHQLQSSDRIDIVWDRYVTNTLKEYCGHRRHCHSCRCVLPHT